MPKPKSIDELVRPIEEDLLSGAAEIALRAITVLQTLIQDRDFASTAEFKSTLTEAARALLKAQPGMAPLFHLGNTILSALDGAHTVEQMKSACQLAFTNFERTLCESAAVIAEHTYDLIPAGDLIFAYSFSSTVVSCLLNAHAKGRYFRVACTESRPTMEGRKLAACLAAGSIEVLQTFDSAMGLILPNCRIAFMGCDSVGRPGVVNKVGSYLLALACRELKIPLYALTGTEKFVHDERLFEFEKHERPGHEVWDDPPKGVRVLNHQFELIPIEFLAGVVTERGILQEKDIERHISGLPVHEALRLESLAI